MLMHYILYYGWWQWWRYLFGGSAGAASEPLLDMTIELGGGIFDQVGSKSDQAAMVATTAWVRQIDKNGLVAAVVNGAISYWFDDKKKPK